MGGVRATSDLWLRMREAGMSAAAVEAAAMDEGLVTRDGSI